MADSQTSEMSSNQGEPITEAVAQPTKTVSESTLPKPEPKILTPEEEAALESKRALAKELYNLIVDLNTYQADVELDGFVANVEADWLMYQPKVNLGDIVQGEEYSETTKKMYDLLKGLSVADAISFGTMLGNAVKSERHRMTKDIKVSELSIKML